MIKNILIFLIKIYQKIISPFLGSHCRFYPSCSEYGVQSIKKHGAINGGFKTLKRMLKCHPWNLGGVDMP
jgi:hypothetical protein